jgi:hypothetical protein
MLWMTRWIAAMALFASALVTAESAASADRPKVEWARVEVPAGQDAARLSKLLREALEKAARKADFGKAKSVTLTARITSFQAERRGDVIRVTCAATGRVKGGASARSKISFGGSPEARGALEKDVLTMVANGLVARLAQIARAKAASEHAPARGHNTDLDGPRRLL